MHFSSSAMVLLVGSCILVSVPALRGAEPGAPAPSYRARLLELGAVPADRISRGARKPSRNDIVHGWVNPRHAGSTHYVPPAVQKEFGLPKAPLSYDRYVSFLLIDEYKKNKSTDLHALMRFSLSEMHRHGIVIPVSQDIIRAYEAGVGLEEAAIRLLGRCRLSAKGALALFERAADARLIYLLPVPGKDEDYLRTLVAWSNKKDFPQHGRFLLKKKLAHADPKRFQPDLREFTLRSLPPVAGKGVPPSGSWWNRQAMYRELIRIGDRQCWDAINHALLHDPIVEVREQILFALQSVPDSPTKVMDTVLQMTEGRGTEAQAVTPCRGGYGYSHCLAGYLKWAESLPRLDKPTRAKIGKAAASLRRNRPLGALGTMGGRAER